MTTTLDSPANTDLTGRAGELVELARKHADWHEENRRLHEEVLDGVRDAGLFRMRTPARYGGLEVDTATTAAVIAELARADGSLGWSMNTWTIGTWLAGLFPDQTQDEIFADPDVRVGNSVSPHGMAVATDGGAVLNGKWPFSTGILHSQWFVHSAVREVEGGAYEPIVVAVPAAELTVVDDWHTSGLRGTGSVTTIAEDLFVPEERIVPMLPVVMENKHLSQANVDSPVWQAPFAPSSAALAGAVPLGMARAAMEAFLEGLSDRKITYTTYEHQSEAPLTHRQVAQAEVGIAEAAFHVTRAAARVDDKVQRAESWTMTDRALARMDMGASTQRSVEAVGVLSNGSGGSSIYSREPIQRIARDAQAVSMHGLLHPDTNLELYGRILCGLEPNTQMI